MRRLELFIYLLFAVAEKECVINMESEMRWLRWDTHHFPPWCGSHTGRIFGGENSELAEQVRSWAREFCELLLMGVRRVANWMLEKASWTYSLLQQEYLFYGGVAQFNNKRGSLAHTLLLLPPAAFIFVPWLDHWLRCASYRLVQNSRVQQSIPISAIS